MFPLTDKTGHATAAMSKPYLVAMCAMPWAASAMGLASWMLPVGAAVPSIMWWRSLSRFQQKPNAATCRRFFLGSLSYLLATLILFTAYAKAEKPTLTSTTSESEENKESIEVETLEPAWRRSVAAKLAELCPHEQMKMDLLGALGSSFVRVLPGEALPTGVDYATSQLFYVIRGRGSSITRAGKLSWKEGDLFTVPYLGDNATKVCSEKSQCVQHSCAEEPHFGGCALYWVHDEPLLKYLGVRPLGIRRFDPTLYPGDMMRESVASIPNLDSTGHIRNRRGILLGNPSSPQTKTVTPTLWSLLNSIGPHARQDPHKHNSVALDMAVSGGQAGKVYSLLGRSLDATGAIVDPLRVEWRSGGVFVTPPGWWHSHHNEGAADAWVLPVQDAGLYTHQRTLDIRFAHQEVANLKKGTSRGATLPELQAEG